MLQFAILLATTQTVPTFAKPNIVVILADDLGYADIGVNGYSTDIATPHIVLVLSVLAIGEPDGTRV